MPDEKYILQQAERLTKKLGKRVYKTAEKYRYYNAENTVGDLGISLPKNFTMVKPGVGWASRAVNTLGDRLNFDGFINDTFSLNQLMDDTGARKVLNRSIQDALIAGCSFVGIENTEEGDIKLTPFTAMEATGEIDERTGLLRRGIAVLEWTEDDDNWKWYGKRPKTVVLFEPDFTAAIDGKRVVAYSPNPTGRPLLHVITHRQSADRPFGKSRISNTVRRIVDEVGRLKVRYEIAAEFYSTPQRYILGLDENQLANGSLSSEIGKIWGLTAGEDGEKPTVGQLAQMSINQFSDQKKDLARDFCAETALTLRNLGYETANPTSAESLSAMSDDLLLEAQDCQRELGKEFKDIILSMRMLLDKSSSISERAEEIEPVWMPIFQTNVGAAGDAIYKLLQIMPQLKDSPATYRMLGLTVKETDEVLNKARRTRDSQFMATEGAENE
jgi:hypothetical protein